MFQQIYIILLKTARKKEIFKYFSYRKYFGKLLKIEIFIYDLKHRGAMFVVRVKNSYSTRDL